MSTLSARATPRQAKVMRMIEGAVRNAADAHPDYKIPPLFARSVAKRAAGTLTSQWGSVLATQMEAPPVNEDDTANMSPSAVGGDASVPCRGVPRNPLISARLRYLHGAVGSMIGTARQQRNLAEVQAFTKVLQLIRTEMDRT